MVKEKMTIHKALSELKIIDDRIEKAISDATFCIQNKTSNEKIKGITVKEFEASMQSAYDKAKDLINRRNAIKRAVVLSNAVTKVNIGDVEYTVAEAIEMKNHGIEFDELMYGEMRSQYILATKVVERENSTLDERAEKYATEFYKDKDSKVDTKSVEELKNLFKKSNEYTLIDPLKVADKMNALEEKISAFKAEVDAVLSVSNATTTIEIEY